MPQPKCPFCLKLHEKSYCDTYDLDIPIDYISKYDEMPPLWLMAVGYSKHGKTCQLAALSLVLENIGRVWGDTAQLYLDQFTRDSIMDMRLQAINGVVPKATPLSYPRPLLFHIYQIPEKGDTCMVLYDTPGELFDKIEDEQKSKFMQFLRQIKSIWFVVSISDMQNRAERRIDDLLSFYLDGMKKMGVSLKGRNLIVTYTKADLVVGSPDRYQFPEEICDYVVTDPFQNVTMQDVDIDPDTIPSMKDYLAEMRTISNKLEDYTKRHIPGGPSMVSIAKRNEMGLYFCITSALGAATKDNTMAVEATRYRVMDPLLWAMELNVEETNQPCRLIMDGSVDGRVIFEGSRLGKFEEAIRSMAEVTCYFSGNKSIAARSNQALPQSSPRVSRPRLIGPILEATPAGMPVVVFAGGPVLDLDDFASTWGDRLLLVSFGEEEHQSWKENLVIRRPDTPDVLISEVRKFIQNYYSKA